MYFPTYEALYCSIYKKTQTLFSVLKHNLNKKLADPGKFVSECKLKIHGTYHSSSFSVKNPSSGQEAKAVKECVDCEDGIKY